MNRTDCDIDIRMTAHNKGYEVYLKVTNLKVDPPFYYEKKEWYPDMPEDFETLILESLETGS